MDEPFDADVYSPDPGGARSHRRSLDALIVGLLEDGSRRFGEIRDGMGITPKVLSKTLKTLPRDGIVERRAYAEMPPRVEYSLTPLGLMLREPLASVRQCAEVHVHDIIAARMLHHAQA